MNHKICRFCIPSVHILVLFVQMRCTKNKWSNRIHAKLELRRYHIIFFYSNVSFYCRYKVVNYHFNPLNICVDNRCISSIFTTILKNVNCSGHICKTYCIRILLGLILSYLHIVLRFLWCSVNMVTFIFNKIYQTVSKVS